MIQIRTELTNFVRPSEHSIYSPSAGDRWMKCAASIKLSEGIADETSKYAAEGTLAHLVCEDLFREQVFGIPFPKKTTMQMVALPDQGQEMMEHADSYVQVVQAWLNAEDEIGKVLWFGMERGVPIFPDNDCFGTGDFVIIGSKQAVMIDFKYGRRAVRADTTQLKLYCLGAYRYTFDHPVDYKWNAVVYQPRVNATPQVHEYSNDDLKAFDRETYSKILETHRDDLVPVEGSHCFFCPAKRTKDRDRKCPAILQKPIDMANQAFGSFVKDMNVKPDAIVQNYAKRDQAIMKVMSLLPLMQQIAKDGEEEFLERMNGGEAIPGVQIIKKQGNRKWSIGDDAKMASLIETKFPLKVESATVIFKKLLTITQVEKRVGRNKLDELIVRPISKKVHVHDSKIQEVLGGLAAYGKMIEDNKQ